MNPAGWISELMPCSYSIGVQLDVIKVEEMNDDLL